MTTNSKKTVHRDLLLSHLSTTGQMSSNSKVLSGVSPSRGLPSAKTASDSQKSSLILNSHLKNIIENHKSNPKQFFSSRSHDRQGQTFSSNDDLHKMKSSKNFTLFQKNYPKIMNRLLSQDSRDAKLKSSPSPENLRTEGAHHTTSTHHVPTTTQTNPNQPSVPAKPLSAKTKKQNLQITLNLTDPAGNIILSPHGAPHMTHTSQETPHGGQGNPQKTVSATNIHHPKALSLMSSLKYLTGSPTVSPRTEMPKSTKVSSKTSPVSIGHFKKTSEMHSHKDQNTTNVSSKRRTVDDVATSVVLNQMAHNETVLKGLLKRTQKVLSCYKQKELNWKTEKEQMNGQILFLLQELIDARTGLPHK